MDCTRDSRGYKPTHAAHQPTEHFADVCVYMCVFVYVYVHVCMCDVQEDREKKTAEFLQTNPDIHDFEGAVLEFEELEAEIQAFPDNRCVCVCVCCCVNAFLLTHVKSVSSTHTSLSPL